MVFAGLFPTDSDQYPELRDALERLKLNDGSLFYEPETSQALGFGFRCGFLGLLHMEIVRERLEREFDLDLLVTAPNVAYRVETKAGEELEVHNPSEMPRELEQVEEPYVRASIIVPKEYVGAGDGALQRAAGELRPHGVPLRGARAPALRPPARRDRPRLLRPAEVADAWLRELRLRLRRLQEGDLVRVDVLIAGEPVDALSLIVHRDAAYVRGRRSSTGCARRSRASSSMSPSRRRSGPA